VPRVDARLDSGNHVGLVSTYSGGHGDGELADVWFASLSAGGQDISSALADALDRYGSGSSPESLVESGANASSPPAVGNGTVDAMLSALSGYAAAFDSGGATPLLGAKLPDQALLSDDPTRRALSPESAALGSGPTLGGKT